MLNVSVAVSKLPICLRTNASNCRSLLRFGKRTQYGIILPAAWQTASIGTPPVCMLSTPGLRRISEDWFQQGDLFQLPFNSNPAPGFIRVPLHTEGFVQITEVGPVRSLVLTLQSPRATLAQV